MNRAMRRTKDKQARRKLKSSGLFVIERSSTFTPEQGAKFSVECRMAWYRMSQGDASTDDFDNLAYAVNIAQELTVGLGETVAQVVENAATALQGIRERFVRLGKFGVDASSIVAVPEFLELHDELLKVCTPNQFAKALKNSLKKLRLE